MNQIEAKLVRALLLQLRQMAVNGWSEAREANAKGSSTESTNSLLLIRISFGQLPAKENREVISKIRDLWIAVMAFALAMMFIGRAYHFFTGPTRQTIECAGWGLSYGPKLDLDGDMARALVNLCKERYAAGREGEQK